MKTIATLVIFSVILGIVLCNECDVSPIHRRDCGWPLIAPEVCEARGCCYDSSVLFTKWCFHKKVGECEVLPNDRRECGWPFISRATCVARGCCFQPTWGAKWCFHKRG